MLGNFTERLTLKDKLLFCNKGKVFVHMKEIKGIEDGVYIFRHLYQMTKRKMLIYTIIRLKVFYKILI